MNCPNCGCEMEKGITAFTSSGFSLINVLYTSEEELNKKGLKNFLTKDRTLIQLTQGDEVTSYHCKECKKLLVSFDE